MEIDERDEEGGAGLYSSSCSDGNESDDPAASSDSSDSSDDVVCRKKLRTILLKALMQRVNGRARPPRAPPRIRPTFDWATHLEAVAHLSGGFRGRYRMELDDFNRLLSILRAHLERHEQYGRLARRSAVIPEVKLALAIRFFSGGQSNDLALLYDVSIPSVYRIVWCVVDAVNAELAFDFPLDDAGKLREIAEGFKAKSANGIFDKVVGCLDGCDIRQRGDNSDEDGASFYVDRKKSYCILVQAICDHHRRFLWAEVAMTPRSHDSVAWSHSNLVTRIERDFGGKLPDGHYLLGDAAYVPDRYMITPGTDDAYNFYQSQVRINIECAFGIFARRWGILWSPLAVLPERRAPLLMCLMALHNFLIDCRLELEVQFSGLDGASVMSDPAAVPRQPPQLVREDQHGRTVLDQRGDHGSSIFLSGSTPPSRAERPAGSRSLHQSRRTNPEMVRLTMEIQRAGMTRPGQRGSRSPG